VTLNVGLGFGGIEFGRRCQTCDANVPINKVLNRKGGKTVNHAMILD